MNKIVLIFSFLCFIFSTICFSQIKKENYEDVKVVINPDAFLLGTFSEYLSRFHLIDKEKQIDIYAPEEKSLGKYIAFFIKQNYKLDANLVEKENEQFEILLPELAQRLHSTYYNNQGQFIKEKLDTDAKKHSYLLGIFYRYGSNLDDKYYEIIINNSTKHSALLELLKDIQVQKISYKATNNLPQIHTFYFEATPKIIKYFDYLKQEKAQLDFSYNSILTFKEINNKTEENQKQKNKKRKELIKSLDYIFE